MREQSTTLHLPLQAPSVQQNYLIARHTWPAAGLLIVLITSSRCRLQQQFPSPPTTASRAANGHLLLSDLWLNHTITTCYLHLRKASSSSNLAQMYVDSAVRFRDPFFPSHKGCAAPRDYQQAQHHWPMSSSHRDFDQALTPPPEMLGPQQTARSAFHANAKDHGQQHASHLQAQQIYRQPVTSHSTQETSNTDYGRSAVAFGKTRSPARAAPYDATHGSSQQRRGSQHQNAIASNFQIPREVNDSGGSLSELAAQVSGCAARWSGIYIS